MDRDHAIRWEALKTPWCPAALVADLLGVDLQADPKLAGAVRAWAARFRGDGPVMRQTSSGLELHRHAVETFLLQSGLVSWKWAAVYLGMDTETLQETVDRLEGSDTLVQLRSDVSHQLVRQREAARLCLAFPSTRNVVFASHQGMCVALHSAIWSELRIEVTPVHCVTSLVLDKDSPDLAVAFDVITMDPVGPRYQIWLDTGKPVSLAPDVCSLKFYVNNEADLRPAVMRGSEPERLPDELRAA